MSDEATCDEEIREMDARLAAQAGFEAEERFDEREAGYDAAEGASERVSE